MVQFVDSSGSEWVANFRPGLGGVTGIFGHPNGRSAMVIANGDL